MSITATIASGASLSGAIRLGIHETTEGGTTRAESRLCGIIMPASWTTADITFQVSDDGVNYYDFYDADTVSEIAYTFSAGKAYRIDPTIFYAANYVKIRSGTSATPVNQAASRDILLVVRVI